MSKTAAQVQDFDGPRPVLKHVLTVQDTSMRSLVKLAPSFFWQQYRAIKEVAGPLLALKIALAFTSVFLTSAFSGKTSKGQIAISEAEMQRLRGLESQVRIQSPDGSPLLDNYGEMDG